MAKCLVLLYHAFGERSSEQDPHNLFVPATAFTEQLRQLLRSGRRPLDHTAFLQGLAKGSWPERSFHVTIDDGYVSAVDVAAPILRAHGVPAVLFMPAERIGGVSDWMPRMPDEPLLDAEALRRLGEFGIDVGSHSLDHPDMRGMTDEELDRQTRQSATALADLTGVRPRSFAYPYGWYDARAAAAVAAAGYEAGFAIRAPHDRFTIPRVDVNATDTMRTFALKLKPWWPLVLDQAGRVPRVRRALHHLIGTARR